MSPQTRSERAQPPHTTRQERKAATRQRIVAAALEQVADGGYASASVHAVAGRAELAAGGIYRHFASKGELFAEVFRRASGRELDLVAAIAAERDRPVRERLATSVEAFARRALAAPTLAFALMAEPVDPAVEAERLRNKQRFRDVFASLLDEGVRAGELAPADTRTVAAAIVGALQEALIGPLAPATNNRHASRSDALVASLIQFCLNAVGAKETASHGLDPRRTAQPV